MTSVPNRLQLLNGNRWLLFLLIALIFNACSPKVRWVSTPVRKPVDTVSAIPRRVPPPIVAAPKVSVISLLLPFGLDHIGPGASYTPVSLKKARVAADYYRGFKLALDSLTYYGYNYKLQVYDSKDEPAQAHKLAYNPQIRGSDLIIGPVFPDDIKAFTSVLFSARKPIVSPLSPESPLTFKNQNLVTVNPPLYYHAWCAAQFINDKIKPQKIFILKSGYTTDDEYIIPFTKTIDSLGNNRIKIIAVAIKHGQLMPLIAQLSKTKQNVFIIPSTNEAFLSLTLKSLDTLARHYPVILFGHPSWQHFAFLNGQMLQRLKTHITSADNVDYKSSETATFIRNYRNTWHAEPTAYAVKGFDEGLYFGQLLATNNLKNMAQTNFTGLHNNFHFEKKPGLGWVNTHVYLLLYTNFDLKQVQ
jgi:hypothetical protein